MSIYNYDDYKPFVLDVCKALPNKGRGQFLKISKHLSVTAVTISQIFRGDRELTLEQGCELAEFLQLSKLETEYFLLMVQLNRAGSHKLRTHLKAQLQKIREQSKELKTRLPQDAQMNEHAKAQFYSNWYYPAIRQMPAIEGFDTVDRIADYLRMPRQRVQEVVNFLIKNGLCLEEKGRLKIGPNKTHIEASSPYISRHHTNWRLRGLEKFGNLSNQEIFYTGPMTLSAKDSVNVREDIIEFVQKVIKRVEPSPSEQLMCLNIDWFKV